MRGLLSAIKNPWYLYSGFIVGMMGLYVLDLVIYGPPV